MDCGGKCEDCRAGCKDPSAMNYDQSAPKEDSSLCEYQKKEDNAPNNYCDVPGATNYEKHEQGDTNYV